VAKKKSIEIKRNQEVWIKWVESFIDPKRLPTDKLARKFNFIEFRNGMKAYLQYEQERVSENKFSEKFKGIYPGPNIVVEFPITTLLKDARKCLEEAREYFREEEIARLDKFEPKNYSQIKAVYGSKSGLKSLIRKKLKIILKMFKMLNQKSEKEINSLLTKKGKEQNKEIYLTDPKLDKICYIIDADLSKRGLNYWRGHGEESNDTETKDNTEAIKQIIYNRKKWEGKL